MFSIAIATFILAAISLLYPQIYSIIPNQITNEVNNHLDKLYPTGMKYGFWATASVVNTYPLDKTAWTKLSPIGIASIFMWLFTLLISILTGWGINRSKYTIGKNNKIIKQLIPVNIIIAFIVIIGLISQPGLIHIPFNNPRVNSFNLMSKYADPTAAVSATNTSALHPDKIVQTLTHNKDLNLAYLNFKNYTVAGYVFFAITIILAISIVIHAIMLLVRALFYKTRDKDNVQTA